jgi:hypothetical protein
MALRQKLKFHSLNLDIPDKNGEILWGFSQWCDLFKGPDFGRSQ